MKTYILKPTMTSAAVKQVPAAHKPAVLPPRQPLHTVTLSPKLLAVGAHNILITPVALNGKRKTDKLDARALCLRLSRYLDGNRDELAPIRIPSEAEQRRREITRRRQFLKRQVRSLANRGHGQVAEYCHQKLAPRWWGA